MTFIVDLLGVDVLHAFNKELNVFYFFDDYLPLVLFGDFRIIFKQSVFSTTKKNGYIESLARVLNHQFDCQHEFKDPLQNEKHVDR